MIKIFLEMYGIDRFYDTKKDLLAFLKLFYFNFIYTESKEQKVYRTIIKDLQLFTELKQTSSNLLVCSQNSLF